MSPTSASNTGEHPTAYYHQDGLLDIFMGVGVLMLGLFWSVEMPWLAGVIVAALVPAWKPARERITFRRLGVAGPPAAGRSRAALLVGLVSGALLFAAGAGVAALLAFGTLSAEARAWLGENLMLMLAGLCALMLLAVAAVMQIRRYYLYAALTAVVLIALQVLNAPIAAYWIGPGLLLMAGGGLLLFRFLRTHP